MLRRCARLRMRYVSAWLCSLMLCSQCFLHFINRFFLHNTKGSHVPLQRSYFSLLWSAQHWVCLWIFFFLRLRGCIRCRRQCVLVCFPVLSYCYGYYVAARCINIKQMVIVSCFLLFLLPHQRKERIENETNKKSKTNRSQGGRAHKTKSVGILSVRCTARLHRDTLNFALTPSGQSMIFHLECAFHILQVIRRQHTLARSPPTAVSPKRTDKMHEKRQSGRKQAVERK